MLRMVGPGPSTELVPSKHLLNALGNQQRLCPLLFLPIFIKGMEGKQSYVKSNIRAGYYNCFHRHFISPPQFILRHNFSYLKNISFIHLPHIIFFSIENNFKWYRNIKYDTVQCAKTEKNPKLGLHCRILLNFIYSIWLYFMRENILIVQSLCRESRVHSLKTSKGT